MRYFSTLLATVAILVAGAAAQKSGYEAICPSLDDGKPHQIVPFYFVEYKCGMLGPNSGELKIARSAGACAIFCKDAGTQCTGSSWMERNLPHQRLPTGPARSRLYLHEARPLRASDYVLSRASGRKGLLRYRVGTG